MLDIRLKNIKYNKLLKSTVFILAAILLTSVLSIVIHLDNIEDVSLEAGFKDNYLESTSFYEDLGYITNNLKTIIEIYKSEDYVKAGKTLDDDTYDSYKYPRELRNLYNQFVPNYYRTNSIDNITLSHKELKNEFEKEYYEEVKFYKNKTIEKELNRYYLLIKNINSIDGLYYYISSDDYEHTNYNYKSKEFYKSQPIYILFDKDGDETSKELISVDKYYTTSSLRYYPQDIMYVALNDDFLTPKIEKWNSDKEIIKPKIYVVILSIIGLLFCIIYLSYVCGQKTSDEKAPLSFIDRIYIDVNIILSLLIIAACIAFTFEFIDELGYLSFIALFIGSTVGLSFLFSIIKHIKNKSIIKHTLCFVLLSKLFSFIRGLFNNAPIIVRMFPTPKKANDLRNIIEGVTNLKNGELHYTIKTNNTDIYGKLANDINSIKEGLRTAVNNELKSQRLKTELISNVSHDIRTPLTSIITYIDLLKKEDLKSSDKEKYLNVLEQKSLRLKTLTDDLFEASKASSGNIPVNFEKIDVASLLTQGMGELDNKIASSGLDFKFNYPQEKIFIKADGKLLWRVIENLMYNVFKYSLKNSRVYIDIIDLDNSASIIIKNISSHELNIDSNELMERFVRGDESRNSEGSGLGLSIAKSLIELQYGKFDIEIDGDLFKAIITIPKYVE